MATATPAAILSVSDKTGLAAFGRRLVQAGWEILSTGGTATHLRDHGVPVTQVSDVTGFPEIMDGRVKTLHPKIHGGLLARRDLEEHRETMEEHDIPDIQIVAVNLYPFKDVVAAEDVQLEEAIENIDIGGPTMLRAAAKNFETVTVVCDPDDYDHVATAVEEGGADVGLRRELALKAFRHTASYDSAISHYLAGVETSEGEFDLHLERVQELRYGENPHQEASLWRADEDPAYGGLEQLHGKALSYNNIVDLDGALGLVREFDEPAAAVIKHTNPAGCASAANIREAFDAAHQCDPMSAFGGIVALNRRVPSALAEMLHEHFFEIVAAPGFDEDAMEVLTQKKNIRLMKLPREPLDIPQVIRPTTLGYLIQDADPRISLHRRAVQIPTRREPTDGEWDALAFSWRVCKHVKSNAIVLARGKRTIGIGAGQMSRVDAVQIAIEKSREPTDDSVLASDAFFPFRDSIDAANDAGVTAVIQPGGSRRDQEVIDACDEHDITMVFTGQRHFRH